MREEVAMIFGNRVDAGRRLATRLEHLRGEPIVVLGLPRGGVPVAFEVAQALDAPLEVIVVRKLGVPFQPELAMGAIGEGEVRVIDEEIVRRAGVSERELAAVEREERAELEQRARQFRGERERVPLAGLTAVIVDDGIATGATARAACEVARRQGATRVVLAVPVAPVEAAARFAGVADEFVCLATPEPFFAIGQFYEDFGQTSDAEVRACLDRATHHAAAAAPLETLGNDPMLRDEEVLIPVVPLGLAGHLTLPEAPVGLVIFAHGSGSSRHSPRNRYVASVLNKSGLATLLFDLLSVEEELDRANVFDVAKLAERLAAATRWVRSDPDLARLAVGYFGASTGAAAALWAATEPDTDVAAVVSRGGRPDLAASHLARVTAPTMFIVGGNDDVVLALNRDARAHLRCESELVVIPNATHLFEEPGALQSAALVARDWFVAHLVAVAQRTG